MYMGVVDGTTHYGDVIKGGPTNLFATPPTVVADPNRHALTTAASATTISCTNYMSEFFNTASFPKGHGFTPEQHREQFGLLYVRADEEHADQGDRARRYL